MTLRQAGCVFAEEEATLMVSQAHTLAELEVMIAQRQEGLPLEQILGWAEFCGLKVAIDPGVFVPRFKTEFLVEQALGLCKPESVVLDLCCGSGALGLAIKSALPSISLFASDSDASAVECARKNLTPIDSPVFLGDLFDALPHELKGKIDILLANAPYVPTSRIELMPREAREFEPLSALDGGGDGLDVHRRIAKNACEWLAPSGHLLIEIGEAQVETATDIFANSGLRIRIVTSEEHEATVLIASKQA